ncbi:HI1506-related protein [Pararhodobacter sp.]|uniref:HI1506-related protein n=1 Tax=Pararhodobacter sp. TaxID=2127056 RepID=UPI002AFE9625|nr:HI1506-related protein [Pararhodobacter sp.]
MKSYTIICSRPGHRRAGIEHPAHRTYGPGELTNGQLELLEGDPLISVIEGDGHREPTFLDVVLDDIRAQLRAAAAGGEPFPDIRDDVRAALTRRRLALTHTEGASAGTAAPQLAQPEPFEPETGEAGEGEADEASPADTDTSVDAAPTTRRRRTKPAS